MKFTAVLRKLVLRIVLSTVSVICAISLLSGCAMPTIDLSHLVAPKAEEVVAADAAAQPGQEETAADGQVDPTSAEADPAVETSAEADGPVEDLTGASPDFSGLVLFTSRSADPFAAFDHGRLAGDPSDSYLWAIAADGKRAGRLSPEGFGAAMEPVANPENKPLVLAHGFDAGGDAIAVLPSPLDCLNGGCGEFQFGLQGRTYAYLSGEDTCGRTLTLVERANERVLNTWTGVSWYYFNRDGGMILAQGDCDKRYVYQYIPNTNQQSGMAPDGVFSWDPTGSAALVQVTGASPVLSGLWGFNLEKNRAILWSAPGEVMQDTPIWLADGRHFVYQHRSIRYDKASGSALLAGPRQIILMDAWTRAQNLLAYDYGADFHLCAGEGQPCDQPYGDWLKVRRTDFVQTGLSPNDPARAAITRCALYGIDCPKAAVDYAINWKTGEILPWADANVPPIEPAPAFPPPDRSREPVYVAPDSSFALFTSADGRTLWHVPSDGDPVLWVTDGEKFVYVP